MEKKTKLGTGSTKSYKTSKLQPNINVKVDELFLTWVNLPSQDVLHENLQAIKSSASNVVVNNKNKNNQQNEQTSSQQSDESKLVLSPRRLNNSFRSAQNSTKSSSRRSSTNTIDDISAKEYNTSSEIKFKKNNLSNKIPLFYFPNGRPRNESEIKTNINKLKDISKSYSKRNLSLDDMTIITKACGCSMYWKSLIFNAAKKENCETITFSEIILMWGNITQNNHDEASRFVALLSKPSNNYLEFEDFLPLMKDIVNTHPGLMFLREAPEFHTRYMNTVIARIFYTINRSWTGKITVNELRKSNFLSVLKSLEDEPDINLITDYFSYEHFYVIYCKFWELDTDHDLVINKTDLAKHGDGVLSMRLIERVLSGAVTRWGESKRTKGTLSYIDFVWFLISEEDKKLPTSIEYWFRCMDLDGDGLISLYEMEYFYEEQIRKLELLDIEPLPFEDCACQMLDMIKPLKPDCISLKDLKQSKMAHLFFDTFLNVEKYLEHEQKDPFANNPFGEDTDEPIIPTQSDWERYATEEYEILVAEEQANEQRISDDQMFHDEHDPAIEEELRNLGLIKDDTITSMRYSSGDTGINSQSQNLATVPAH